MKIKEWEIFFFKVFSWQYSHLVMDVESLRDNDPIGYKSHPKTKLLASLQKVITIDVPEDPFHPKYMLGKSLNEYKEWRRVKRGLPPRYRLFFRFFSKNKKIIFVWLNDEGSIRKKGDKHDVYAVFKKMLDKGEIPISYKELVGNSYGVK